MYVLVVLSRCPFSSNCVIARSGAQRAGSYGCHIFSRKVGGWSAGVGPRWVGVVGHSPIHSDRRPSFLGLGGLGGLIAQQRVGGLSGRREDPKIGLAAPRREAGFLRPFYPHSTLGLPQQDHSSRFAHNLSGGMSCHYCTYQRSRSRLLVDSRTLSSRNRPVQGC